MKYTFVLSRCLFNTLAILAILIALYGLIFRSFSATWTGEFTWVKREVQARFHFISGPLVLFLGLFQFSQKLRKERPQVHRWIGRIYVTLMLISIGSIYSLVWYSAYGLVPQISLFILNCLWLITLLVAVYFIAIKKDIAQHKDWMIRNYALTCSAITLRIIFAPLMAAGYGEIGYKIACTNCYFWNMCLAEIIIYKMKQENKIVKNSPVVASRSQVSNSDNQTKCIQNENNNQIQNKEDIEEGEQQPIQNNIQE